MKYKLLFGVAGVTLATVAAWRMYFPWIGADLKILKVGFKFMKKLHKDRDKFLIDLFESTVKRSPDKVFIIYEDKSFTYKVIDEYANKVTNIVKSWGLTVGDTVALYCTNSPQFVWTLLGLLKLGVTVAMINTSLQSKALIHSVTSCGATVIIVGEGDELLNTVKDAADEMPNVRVYVQGQKQSTLPRQFLSFDELMSHVKLVPVDNSVRCNMNIKSTCCYIYTSGTTGLPKPIYIDQFQARAIAVSLYFLSVTENDVIYATLPLFHTAGSMNMWSCMNAGATIVLKKKFSASKFWPDIRKYNVTIFQYIGEVCRYLLSIPPSPLDAQHKVRAIMGNGLRKDIWENFQTRFKIPLILEFFSAADGNTMLMQLSNKPGSCGRMSPFMKMLEPLPRRLVKYDYTTAEPIRDNDGRCIEIKPGEIGLFLSGVDPLKKNKLIYKSDEEATSKKLVRNAFVNGDIYYNFGDLLYLDKDYFVYFNDRIGDTFRWKGENVSTTEVANILTHIDFIQDANVYGVAVPGQDGRAGMAAITLNSDTEMTSNQLQELYTHCKQELPSYAAPIFLRVLKDAILTATFKQSKKDIVEEGFDPSSVKDLLFFRDQTYGTYVPLTTELYPKILKTKL